MAKQSRVDPHKVSSRAVSPFARSGEAPGGQDAASRTSLARGVALALLSGSLVYVLYYPSDSVAVERGDALWLAAIAIITATIAWALPTLHRGGGTARWTGLSYLVDGLAIGLALWVAAAAFATSPPGNLRQATNEAWLWITGAAVFTASRRLLLDATTKRAVLVLLVGIAVSQSVHAMHQQWVSLPRNLKEYREDPERILQLAGVDAPPGSATRMVFENRLLDGGPTGTFALANSLAAALLLGFIVLVGGTAICWKAVSPGRRLVAGALSGWILIALLATHSRSGLLAALLGGVAVVAWALKRRWGPTAWSGFAWVVGLLAASALAAIAVASLAVWGKEEWISQAPSSLAFRFQYWRATWRMVGEYPVWGVGPGNFQAVYPRYRDANAAESIAEPHNFLLETLAAGGFVAGIVLVMLILAVVACAWKSSRASIAPSGESHHNDHPSRWWWLGGGLAFAVVWVLGLATGQSPDWEAHALAVPVALVAMRFAWRSTEISDPDGPACEDSLQGTITTALAALLLHLLVSGGWTVPGVAAWVWVLAAMKAPAVSPINIRAGVSVSVPRVATAVLLGGLLLVSLRWMSLGPVESAASAMRQAAVAQSNRQVRRAVAALEQAEAADPWSPEASLWLADLYHWQVLLNPDDAELRRRWRDAVEKTVARGGQDPSLLRLVAIGPLHVYQRTGREEDLRWAGELFASAGRASPTDAAVWAQRAEIAEELGDTALAREAAERAVQLSELGENLERRLWLQQILVVEPLGEAATRGPVLRRATELLANQLDSANVARETNTD